MAPAVHKAVCSPSTAFKAVLEPWISSKKGLWNELWAKDLEYSHLGVQGQRNNGRAGQGRRSH